MCNLTKESDLTSVIVYKVVTRDPLWGWIAPFSGMVLQTGNVKDSKFLEKSSSGSFHNTNKLYPRCTVDWLQEEEYKHKVSGFEKKSDASKMIKGLLKNTSDHVLYGPLVILKMEIQQKIMEGYGKNIINGKSLDQAKIYAGKFIKSMEEV